MAALLLCGAYWLSGEGARLASETFGQKETVIVVDAGHGGRDPGKVGVNQVEEKTLNLEIAGRVRDRLEEKGMTVVMTREEDQGLYDEDAQNKKVQDLQRRCELIHNTAPICAVSIHQNSYSDSSVRGPQVFYYKSSQEGRLLAESIQESMRRAVAPDSSREAKGDASYYMLRKTDVPLVIVECGFLSNPEEAELLGQGEYQDKLAEAITSGLEAYLADPDTSVALSF